MSKNGNGGILDEIKRAGVKVDTLARRAGMSPQGLRLWLKNGGVTPERKEALIVALEDIYDDVGKTLRRIKKVTHN